MVKVVVVLLLMTVVALMILEMTRTRRVSRESSVKATLVLLGCRCSVHGDGGLRSVHCSLGYTESKTRKRVTCNLMAGHYT